jgi:hypothetical protein
MNRRPNRVVLTVLAILLVALGAFLLLAAEGVVALDQPADVYRRTAAGAADYPAAWLLGLIVGGLVVAVLGLWLVARQFRWRPGGRLDTVVVQRADHGRTTLQAAAAADAAAADLRRRPPITGSAVRMVTFGSRPRLYVDLDVAAETDVHRALETAEESYQRLAGVLGVDAVSVDTRLRPTAPDRARVQ